MRYRVTHTTTYAYEEIVSICHNELRLEPRSAPQQRCLARRDLAVAHDEAGLAAQVHEDRQEVHVLT